MPSFDSVRRAVRGVPFMTADQGRRIHDHLRASGATRALELGTAHGVSAAYMASAGVQVVTVDHLNAGYSPKPEEVLKSAGVAGQVDLVRSDDSNYNWWLADQVENGERFDFCYLDGSHNFTIDGFAIVLIEKMLPDGGWLLLDDLGWIPARIEDANSYDPRSPHSVAFTLSERELRRPHMRRVLDVVVLDHPTLTQVHIEGDWAWIQKLPGAERTYSDRPEPLLRRVRRRLGVD